MMNRLDWGGTCLARYGHGHNPTAFISKKDEIMSKYRRIAPKPSTGTSNTCESNSNSKPDSKSALGYRSKITARKGNKNNNAEIGTSTARPNRSRRRGASDGPKTPSPRGPKRARGPNKPAGRSTQIFGATVPASIIGADRPKAVYPFNGSVSAEKVTVEKDSGFMERAAVSAFTEGSMVEKKISRFGGLNIKGVMDSLGKVAVDTPTRNMDFVPVQKMEDAQCGCGSPQYLVFPIVGKIQQQQEVEKNERNLVTLPLLPGTPSLEKDADLGSPASSSTCTNYRPDMPDASSDKGEFQLRLFGINFIQIKVVPCQISRDESPKPRTFVPIVDFAFVQKMYSGSVDPVVLLLDSDLKNVLWCNPAYERMVKANEERNCNIRQPLTMFPTPLACCSFKPQGMLNLKAVLWGFVNNFAGSGSYNESAEENREKTLMSSTRPSIGHPMQRSTNDTIPGISAMMESLSPVKNGVIIPQPVRPVGSSVSIEYVKEANQKSFPLCKSMDEIKEQTERETFPALISDSKNKVKWANSAYKKMVGQPECSWLESSCNDNSEGPSTSTRINGEVVLNDEIPLPANALSCCARIQWTNIKGEKISIRAPCEGGLLCFGDDIRVGWSFLSTLVRDNL